jgi:hypothetical protein
LEELTPNALATAIRACLVSNSRYANLSAEAIEVARKYSLESWRDTIGGYLSAAWGSLRSSHA